ncbi:MAG TPA: pyrroloquinoline quinone biosynthesis protein PqqE [Ktedonobacteraceae bacterium]
MTTSPNQTRRQDYRPFGLLAEMTYRCPLHCPYCSNPVNAPAGKSELSTAEWQRIIQEASDLGVLHVLFSGGEPLLRKDLPELVTLAHTCGLYTNLITSGVGLTRSRLQALCDAGLDSIQISFQADQAELADPLAGTAAHTRKLVAAQLVKEFHLPLTINVVLHRTNIERLEQMIALAEQLDAQRLELANTQYLGWAYLNKEALLPTREQVERAQVIAQAAQARLRGKMEILYVLPDYFGERPKPCMHGWGRRYLTINPSGDVMPCQTAAVIPDLRFANIREHSLAWIWHDSPAFQRFRGTEWMPEPCQSCSLREIDFGGCRCQAFLLTGDASRTDPVCQLSPDHQHLQEMVQQIQRQESSAIPTLRLRVNPV